MMNANSKMKWISISGSWRHTNEAIERDVEIYVSELIAEGKGIVVGGALGVDFIATQTAIAVKGDASAVKIVLPTSLEIYRDHFNERANEGVITQDQCDALMNQLEFVAETAPENFIEMGFKACTPETYHDRNTMVISGGSELAAFHVNGTQGVQDAIDKARAAGKPVQIFEYKI